MGGSKKPSKRQQVVVKPPKAPDLLSQAEQAIGELCKLFKSSNLKAALKSGQLCRVADTIRSLVTTAAQQGSYLVTIPLLRQLHRVTAFVHLLLHIHTTKDPQHWNQRFSQALCSLLAASAAVLQLAYPPSGLSNDADKLSQQAAWAVLKHSADPVGHILQAATAVAQALQQHHKQQQEHEQQQQRAQKSKKQQLEQQEQLLRLQQVAAALLEWWLPMQQLWVDFSPDDDKPAAVLKLLQPAVDLAAALVQTVSGDSAPQQFQAIAKVTYRCAGGGGCQHVPANWGGAAGARSLVKLYVAGVTWCWCWWLLSLGLVLVLAVLVLGGILARAEKEASAACSDLIEVPSCRLWQLLACWC
jgi:hypothetical protein